MSESWKEWSGQVVNNEFPLLQFLGESEHSAVFLTERNEDGAPSKATIKLVPSLGQSDELQLARWRMATELSHPHLLRVYGMGRTELGHVPLLYVVAEYAEENLAEFLSARALPPDEVRAVLDSALSVLTYLHGKNLVHGHLKPGNIMAIGDKVKLSSDRIHRVGKACDRPGRPDAYDSPETVPGIIPIAEAMSPAADIWSLGIALVEILTQKLPATPENGQREPQLPEGLPEPYLDIARHCLLRDPQSRWTAAQIATRLQNPSAKAVLEPSRPLPVAQPPISRQMPPSLPRKRRSYAVPIAIGLALVAALAVPRFFGHRSEPPPVSDAASELPAAQSAPAASDLQNNQPILSAPGAKERKRNSTTSVPVPVSIRSATPSTERIKPAAKLPAGAIVSGEVAERVLPDVTESARKSIRGTVKVILKVEVDPSGNVDGMILTSPSASKYFNSAALDAAQKWKFKPPQVAGRDAQSNWSLRFAFTRGETTVVPTQLVP
jgi:TonB family protein